MVDVILAVCLAVAIVVAMVLNIRRLREKSVLLSNVSRYGSRFVVNRALRQLNCKVEWRKDKNSDVGHYSYQGGHFNITLDKDSPYARLTFLFFFETDVADIEQARTVCNLCNLNTDTARVVYTLDNKKGKVDLHIISVLPVGHDNMREELERSMADAFRWQNAYVARFKDLEKEAHKTHGADSEKANAQYVRDLELIHEQEMMHQDEGPEWHENAEGHMELRSLLATTVGLTDIIPIKFTLAVDDRLSVMEDPDAILCYPVSSPLIDHNAFAHHSATGSLDFYDPRDPVMRRHLMVSFEQETSTADTLYYRVTIALVPLSLGRNVGEESERHGRQMTSVLIGYDLTPAGERIAHFRYVWKEAMGKMQNGNGKDLTEEEKVIADMQDPHLAYNFYHGRSLYLRRRYYEALRPLEDAFHAVTNIYDAHDHNIVDLLDEVAYYIGCCYMCLHQYERACYYLQLTLPTNHRSYSEAYINCLVNGGDYRAMDILNGLLGSLQMMLDHMGDDDDDEETKETPGRMQIQHFINFIKRRKAYLLVSLKRYDEAERILKQLLDDPDNSDFALNELAYIQKHSSIHNS